MPRLTAPVGNGVWIWNLTNCEGGNLDAIAAVARRCNVHWVAIKAFDGEWRWSRQWSKAAVDRLHDAGISVALWWYSVSDWQGQAQDAGGDVHACTMAAELDNLEWALAAGADFAIIDPEKEWCLIPGKRDDPAGHALAYGQELRKRIGTFPVYAGIVPSDTGYWVGNPLPEIAQFVDGTCPQVYTWSWGAEVGAWTDKAIRLSHGKPCYPIYESSSGAPNDYMAAAVATAVNRGCRGISWWSWEHAEDRMWQAIQAAGSRLSDVVAAGIPVPDPSNVSATPQAVRWYLNGKGQTIVEVNFGGTASKIEGINFVDLGVTVSNAAGEVYDRSVKANAFQPWVKR